MRKSWPLLLFTGAFLVGFPLALHAQEQQKKHEGWVPEEGAVQIMLLRQKSVQEALKLTDEETRKIHEFAREQWEKARKADELSPEGRREKFTEMTRENERFIKENLKPAQCKRLDEITLQVAGLLWVTRPEIASKLELTEDQKARAHNLQQEAREEMREYIHTSSKENRKEKLRELNETSHKRLWDLLTDEQEAKWRDLAGDRFLGEMVIENAEREAPESRSR